jgi:transcriptional regulator of acetoin/glycerol metabolism
LVRISGGNITEASKLSGQYRANIYRLLKKHQMAHGDYIHGPNN